MFHSEVDKLKCNLCDYTCRRNDELKLHNRAVHEKKKQFKCENCVYHASHQWLVNKHVERVHNKGTYDCDECNFESLKKVDLNKHKRETHVKKAKLKCEQCSFETTERKELTRHCKRKNHKLLTGKNI